MRTRFFADLVDAMKDDSQIVFITGDLGFGVIEPLVDATPEQVINAGVAEQNMTGMAAGIALAGAKVFTYSIANFPTLRCLEQIRNDVVYHQADVTVVAVGGGLAYGALGMSHHATEDLAIMRSIPGLAVAAPGDPVEVGVVVDDLLSYGGPAYLRLGKAGEPTIHEQTLSFGRGDMVTLRDGFDLALLSTGGMLPTTAEAAQRLDDQGISAAVVSVPWISPFDAASIADLAARYPLLVTVEEHSIQGGLGSATAEVLAELPLGAQLTRIGLPHQFSSVVGSQEYLRVENNLTADAICARVIDRWKEIS